MSLWRRNTDFVDLERAIFPIFESICTVADIRATVSNALSFYQIPVNFADVLSQMLWDYCNGKVCNRQDSASWKRQFTAEIGIFLIENGRYLQAMLRDVNQNIGNDGSWTETRFTGESTVNKRSEGENTQESGVDVSNQQSGSNALGNTLSVLNNQSTSTQYLASANEESYSTGEINEQNTSGSSQSDTTRIRHNVDNGAKLGTETVDHSATKSPLEISQLESSFSFQKWFDEILKIVDSYFLGGGVNYA